MNGGSAGALLSQTVRSGERVEWIDVAKGVGIILVVIGHSSMKSIADEIYYFHMPLFFMLAGTVFKPAGITDYFTKRVRSL